MGLFSKKTVTCERCGKEYELRIDMGRHLCPECKAREEEKRNQASGYISYGDIVLHTKYSEEQLDQIIAHREQVLEKYRVRDGITCEELQTASENYKKLTDDQAESVLHRMWNSQINVVYGAEFTTNFFVPIGYKNIVVDATDVFAIGYAHHYNFKFTDKAEPILCVFFTNDPYVPIFQMILGWKKKFLEVESEEGREYIQGYFGFACPNLTYPIQELNTLKKTIKKEDAVKGNIEKKFMLKQISDAAISTGLYDGTSLSNSTYQNDEMLEAYGYITPARCDQILRMDSMFNRNYWVKQMRRLNKIWEETVKQQ